MGSLLREQGKEQDAISHFKTAALIEPTKENLSLSKLHFSGIPNSTNEIKNERDIYLSNIIDIFKDRKVEEKEKNFIDLRLFSLTYQNGADDKILLEKIAKLVHPWLDIPPQENISKRTNSIKVQSLCSTKRIGFYFDNPHKEHVIFQHYYNLVNSFDRKDFEITLIKGPLASHRKSEELEKATSKTIQLPKTKGISQLIRELDLDVLVYTEMHSSSVPYSLAHNRLAKHK